MGIRAFELQPDFKPDFKTIRVCRVENIKDMEMSTKCLNIHYIYGKTDARGVVHRRREGVFEQVGGAEQHITERRRQTN